MPVLAIEAVRKLVGLRLADHPRAGVEQSLHGDRGAIGGNVSLEPARIAESGAVSGDVIEVLDAERRSAQRSVGRAVTQRAYDGKTRPAYRAENVVMLMER
jgi:hypothetical protein